jgi:hypothetical protein
MIDTIKSFKYAQPFESFHIELSSGLGSCYVLIKLAGLRTRVTLGLGSR